MASKSRSVQLGTVIADVEAVAKRLRTDIRKRADALPKDLKAMAARLRKQAARAAAQVEEYAHEVRVELESISRRATAKRPARRKPGKRGAA
jgi:hypothetical protein